MDAVESGIFGLDMIAIVYQYLQLNSVGEEMIKCWYTCSSKTFFFDFHRHMLLAYSSLNLLGMTVSLNI